MRGGFLRIFEASKRALAAVFRHFEARGHGGCAADTGSPPVEAVRVLSRCNFSRGLSFVWMQRLDWMHLAGFALRALAQVDSVYPLDAFRGGFGVGRGRGLTDELPDAGHGWFAHGIAQIAVMPDAGEAAGKNVQKEAAEELGAVQGDAFLFGGVFGVAVAEADVLVRHLKDARARETLRWPLGW